MTQVIQNKPIVIIKGDDSNFCNNTIRLNIQVENQNDLTGFFAVFQLQCITFTFSNVSAGYVDLIFDGFKTKHLITGRCNGYLKLYDSENRCRTSGAIEFIVKPQEVCDK